MQKWQRSSGRLCDSATRAVRSCVYQNLNWLEIEQYGEFLASVVGAGGVGVGGEGDKLKLQRVL
jgi:hypothetical protein